MKDRVSTKILNNGATRYGVYDETGDLLRYEYIKLEDEPSTEGDFFNKANMLPDSITAMLGLKMSNPQVADALNVLANVGNLHVWERKCLVAEAGYTLGDLETVNITHGAGANYSSGNYSSWVYSDKISVNETGVVSLVNPTKTNDLYYNAYSNANVLAGKYAQINPNISPTHSLAKLGFVYFFPAGNSASRNTDDGSYNITLPGKIVTGYPAGTTTDYLTSTDRNAYHDNATDGSDAYYTLGAAGYLNFYYSENDGAVTWKYSSSISVDADGTVSLVSPSRTEMTADDTGVSSANNLKGKFVLLSAKSNYTDATHGVIYYIPADATISYQVSSTTPWYIQTNKAQPVTGHAAIPASTTITYLGQLGGGARIEVGSYVGTGTYGSSNPCSVTASFPIKRLSVFGEVYANTGNYFPTYQTSNSSSYSMYDILLTTSFASRRGIHNGASKYGLDYSFGKRSVDGRTFWWYSSGNDASFQLNESGVTYYYIAIG